MAVVSIKAKDRLTLKFDSEKRIITCVNLKKRMIVSIETKARFPTTITNEEQ